MLRLYWWKFGSFRRRYQSEAVTSIVTLALIGAIFFAVYWSAADQWPNLPTQVTSSLSFLSAGFLFVLGTIYSRARDRREGRRNRAIGLVTEWHSPDVRSSRMFVSHYRTQMAKNKEMPALSQIENNAGEERRKLTEKEILDKPELERWSLVELHFFRIYQFFERWSLYLRGGDLDRHDSRFYLSSYCDWYVDEFIIPWFKTEDELMISGKGGDHHIRQALGRIILELRGRTALRSAIGGRHFDHWSA